MYFERGMQISNCGCSWLLMNSVKKHIEKTIIVNLPVPKVKLSYLLSLVGRRKAEQA